MSELPRVPLLHVDSLEDELELEEVYIYKRLHADDRIAATTDNGYTVRWYTIISIEDAGGWPDTYDVTVKAEDSKWK